MELRRRRSSACPSRSKGFAFFTEAIFLGIYLYGWDRVSPRAHWRPAWSWRLSGALSGVFVVIANAWMNTPAGFRHGGRQARSTSTRSRRCSTRRRFPQTLHMTLAAYAATGFAVAGIHALHAAAATGATRSTGARSAIALAVGGGAALLQPLSGDICAQMVADDAAGQARGHGGAVRDRARRAAADRRDPRRRRRRDALRDRDPGRPQPPRLHTTRTPRSRGSTTFPREDWPPVAVVHIAFQIMVGAAALVDGGGRCWAGLPGLAAPGVARFAPVPARARRWPRRSGSSPSRPAGW